MLLYKHAMNPTGEEAGQPQPSALAQATASLYESVGGVLLRFLADRFGLPPKEAEALLGEACYEAVRQNVRNREAWTIAFSCNGAQTLRRRHDEGTAAPPPDITLEEIEALRGVVLVSKALFTLTEHGREALRLRFRERRSYAEIAAELDISTRYAKHLVFQSLQRLRASQRACGFE
jgi:DNA-directed RNA polymerase specialized sigma24 family protein